MKEEVVKPIPLFESFLEDVKEPIHIVDYHGESTSEKQIFAYSFDGTVSAVIGTHTHVPTADARLLPKGTAFQADAGYCGAYDSIIGFETDSVIDKLVLGKEGRFEIPYEGDKEVDCVLLEVDEETGLATKIEPIRLINGKEVVYGPHHL